MASNWFYEPVTPEVEALVEEMLARREGRPTVTNDIGKIVHYRGPIITTMPGFYGNAVLDPSSPAARRVSMHNVERGPSAVAQAKGFCASAPKPVLTFYCATHPEDWW